MSTDFNTTYPPIGDLRAKTKRRVPRFAFEYLDGGCNENINLHLNTADLREVQLQQIMEQLCCERVEGLPSHLISS